MLVISWTPALNGMQKNLQVKIHQQDGLRRNKTLSGKTKRHELRSNFDERDHYESQRFQYPIGPSLVPVN